MATTARGFHYPSGSDKVGDTDLKIKDLADDVDARVGLVQSGVSAFASGPAVGTHRLLAVVFAKPYPVGVTPDIVVCVRANATTGPHQQFASVDTVTAASNTGFTIRAVNTLNTNAMSVAWMARG